MGYYRIAQICLNGHVITSSADTNPEFKENFCSKCGSQTIMNCQSCGCNIKGDYETPNFVSFFPYQKPLYCNNCGQPYPWTKEVLNVAKELLELDESLTNEEMSMLSVDIENIVKDSPRTQLSATRLKSLLSKISSGTANALRDILVDVASETAKKIIWSE